MTKREILDRLYEVGNEGAGRFDHGLGITLAPEPARAMLLLGRLQADLAADVGREATETRAAGNEPARPTERPPPFSRLP